MQVDFNISNSQTMKTKYQYYTLEDTCNREVTGGLSVAGRSLQAFYFVR
jgi:hypothetical protein